jgi:hypothetical protein
VAPLCPSAGRGWPDRTGLLFLISEAHLLRGSHSSPHRWPSASRTEENTNSL